MIDFATAMKINVDLELNGVDEIELEEHLSPTFEDSHLTIEQKLYWQLLAKWRRKAFELGVDHFEDEV